MSNLERELNHTKSGLIEKESKHSVAETLYKLEKLIAAKGMKVFARINHAAAANAVELELRPTEVLIFGDPKIGTPLMNQHPLLAVDLPFRVLAWEDENSRVWLVYNSPLYLRERYMLEETPFPAMSSLIEMAAE